MTLAQAQEAYLSKMDIDYSYQLAKSMEQFRSNPALGYRTAGSRAEFETGEMLFHEMRRIGLQEVVKDPFTLDTWEFERARLSFTDESGTHQFELGGYQTNFNTHGPKDFSILYAGKGTESELSGLNVEGKLVLIDINQRDEWWISYPVYQAHLRGAAAVIAVQQNGYGEVDSAALNAQNICSVADAPAFSLSQADARVLKAWLMTRGGEAAVSFDAKSVVGFDGISYNIVGRIPGRDPDAMVLVSAHYDSYFSGFQDDNAAVALMMGIAKAVVKSGYRPEKTLVFCALAAEEWGVSNSKYDWSTGAYNQVFRVHPEWAGKVIADINFELPAYAHDTQDVIRCVWELQPFLQSFAAAVPDVTHLFPDGLSVASPALTWSDDFSMSIAGIPSLVNDFAEGSFMETHYHSQFDNDDAYDPEIYRFHHALYGCLLLWFDRCAVPPLDFMPRLSALRDSLAQGPCSSAETALLSAALDAADTQAALCRSLVQGLNHRYADALDDGDYATAEILYRGSRELSQRLLDAFKHCEDGLVRLGWHDEVLFPHAYAQRNLALLAGALEALKAGDAARALDCWLIRVDTNWYACYFDEQTCRHFVDYVLQQPPERLMWGAGRVPGLCALFGTMRSLMSKRDDPQADFTAEIRAVKEQIASQQELYRQSLLHEQCVIKALARKLEKLVKS
ncbi:M28 family peptidase [Anaerotruncus rubiinfantis]|uniref:M28 family peptidase n=1 Tax=Anaerotruncus rubiinfantis TaxID=1720200 RepID=UPI0034A3B3EE